jgi:DNA gyrase/topoisomerase IV subunit A
MNNDVNYMSTEKIAEMTKALGPEEQRVVVRELPTNVIVHELWDRINELTEFKKNFEELMSRDFRKKE